MIAYDAVVSSNIRALGFEKGVGYVEFIGGRRFAYTMTKAMFDEMKAAKSIGSYFAKNVKSKCPVVWTGHCCDNSPCKANATLVAAANAPAFKLCDPCSKIPRFINVAFSPIPESR